MQGARVQSLVGWGTKIPCAVRHSQKKKEIRDFCFFSCLYDRQKSYGNKILFVSYVSRSRGVVEET